MFVLSFLLVALGQPAWIPLFAPFAASCGYALFWRGCEALTSAKKKFWVALTWYALVQSIQLSWMTSIEYQGYYILAVYIALVFLWGLQFGLLSHFVGRSSSLRFFDLTALASFWVVLEWSRLFLLCGFSWNPAGMALTTNIYTLQWASLFGIFGLSFWVIFSNLLTLRVLKEKRGYVIAGLVVLLPFLFGFVRLMQPERNHENHYSTALVQTNLLPPQKLLLPGLYSLYLSPLDQWHRILIALKELEGKKIDLIVFPEAAVSGLAERNLYALDRVRHLMRETLGEEVVNAFPRIEQQQNVSHLFIAQTLANFFHAHLVIGLEDWDAQSKNYYQSAFFLTPDSDSVQRQEKMILLPLAEYIPFSALRVLTAKYGIHEFYTPGKAVKVMEGALPASLSICYEETFSHFMRKGRKEGANLFINISNDNWYPNSQLGEQHFDHARLRAVENGVPLIRACNVGMSAAVDRFGSLIDKKLEKGKSLDKKVELLITAVPMHTCSTLYTHWGDWGIVLPSFLLTGVFFMRGLILMRSSKPLAENV